MAKILKQAERALDGVKAPEGKHSRVIQLSEQSLRAFLKQYGRLPKQLEMFVDIHRPCARKVYQMDGSSRTCRIASIEHDDKHIGHIFTIE